MISSLRSRLDRLTPGGVFLVVLIPLCAIYFATAARGLPYYADAYTNALTAWKLGTQGTLYVDEFPELADDSVIGRITWFVETSSGHLISKYPPGTAIIAAPLYAIYGPSHRVTVASAVDSNAPTVAIPLPSLVPAAIAAAAMTALAMAFLALAFSEFLPPSNAVTAAYVAGLGTGAWAVASNALWQHGPAMLWIALALYLTSRRHLLGAGFAFGMAILTRPHTALIAAAVGLAIALTRRAIRPALKIGVGSVLGLAALVAYNWVVFGSLSVSGGYGSGFTYQALHSSVWWYLRNITSALVDPKRGLLIWAPFLIILIPGIVKAWRAAPSWARGAALGGLLYLLLQLKANYFSGGDGFFAYRYPLEALISSAPLLILSWKEWVAHGELRMRLFKGTIVIAAAGQAIGAILY